MIIYHGSNCEIRYPEILMGRYAKDFGQGFYATAFLPQAQRWARRKSPAVVNSYDYEPPSALNVRHFEEMTEDWLDFIVASRKGDTHSHDVVIGAMANDQVYNYIMDFMDGILTCEQFWILAKFKHPTHQIAFCTPQALSALKFISSWEVE